MTTRLAHGRPDDARARRSRPDGPPGRGRAPRRSRTCGRSPRRWSNERGVPSPWCRSTPWPRPGDATRGGLVPVMIRPAELTAIKDGTIDLAFRRWDRPRVKVGTRMRTGVGAHRGDLGRAGAAVVAPGRRRPPGGRLVRHRPPAGPRPPHRPTGVARRPALRRRGPARDAARAAARPRTRSTGSGPGSTGSTPPRRHGPWTRASLELIDRNPGVRAPDLAARARAARPRSGRPTSASSRRSGLTESLAIGYRLSPRGEVVLDHGGPPRERAPRPEGTPLPRAIGAPATGALRVRA